MGPVSPVSGSKVLVVRFDLRDASSAERFDALLAAALPAVAREEGTERYDVHRAPGEPLCRVVVSRYRDEAAHQAHNRAPAMAALIASLPELAGGVRVEELAPVQLTPPTTEDPT